MPLPRSVARFNKRVTNRLTGLFAPYLPHFGVVIHTGRRTHRVYRTPVNVFSRPGGYVIALTYGPINKTTFSETDAAVILYGEGSDWVQNVLASGGCELQTRGSTVRLTRPRLIHDEVRRAIFAPLRLVGKLGNVSDFLELDRADGSAEH